MRPIKFKVWDKLLNKFVPFNSLTTNFESEEYVYLQFTGLRDKNNKDLFEGDLVKIDPNHITNKLRAEENPNYTRGKIRWLCQAFKVCQEEMGATYLADFSACECCPCGLEIIGNIFENPELLS